MPYIRPDNADACKSCRYGPDAGTSTNCDGCKCADPEWMQYGLYAMMADTEHSNWELGYRWDPAEWVCDHCKERYFYGLRDPAFSPHCGPTICDECLQVILVGIEVMRKAGLSVYGPGQAYQADGFQVPGEFYWQLSHAGKEGNDAPD